MKKSTIYILTLLFILGLVFLNRQHIEPLRAFADIWSRETFLASTPYGVAEAHDTESTLRKAPAIYWGLEKDGSIDLNAGTYQYAFNDDCEPMIFIQPIIDNQDVANESYTVHIRSHGNKDAVLYEVRKSVSGTITDVTASHFVFWVAFGWR